MLLSNKINVTRIVRSTWKHFAFNVVICIATYLVARYAFDLKLEIPVLLPTILGTALSFFIGFSNNQAYDRWWEARKIWGCLVNDSRTWARQLLTFSNPDAMEIPTSHTPFADRMIKRHIAFLYALKDNLRKTSPVTYETYLSAEENAFLKTHSNKANAILILQSTELNHLYSEKLVDAFQFVELDKTLVSFTNEMGKSERIANTVFPTTYTYYTKMFIWIFIISVTLVLSQFIGPWSILMGVLIGYVFLTTHTIGYMLLNPFSEISTGTPLDQITRTIEINLLQSLHSGDIPKPVESVNGEYIM